ncbi:MAG TPA: SMC-Scp complex subunit ScpB [Clostridiales bacterium]|nr:SMC-Scp complex subunit ScpB [Clostridiales bacterium]
MNRNEICGVVMAALFVSGDAMEVQALAQAVGVEVDAFDVLLQEMMAEQELKESGILLTRVGDKVQLCTNKKYAACLKELFAPDIRESLTGSVLETLSIIAYRQPVTRPEIDDIRGVRSNYAVSILREKGLIAVTGKKDVLGRPSLFATTDEFLRHLGISSLAELPALEQEQAAGARDAFDEPRAEEEELAIAAEEEE